MYALITLYYIELLVHVTTSSTCYDFGTFIEDHNFSGKTLSAGIIATKVAIPRNSKCESKCIREEDCVSYFYSPHTKICQLNSVIYLSTEGSKDSPGTRYYRKQLECPATPPTIDHATPQFALDSIQTTEGTHLAYVCESTYDKEGLVKCEINGQWTLMTCKRAPIPQFDCNDVMLNGYKMDAVYTIISRDDSTPISVFCELSSDDPGWLVIQRRTDGSEDFYRIWDDYKNGFGNMTNEFWLGNSIIHKVTTSSSYELRIDLEDFEGNTTYAVYDSFSLDSEEDFFKLNLGNYSGTAGDSFSYHGGHYFSTKDTYNSEYGEVCVASRKSGWWFNRCTYCNLNGPYLHGYHEKRGAGVDWYDWRGPNYSLKTSVMKIRRILN